MIKARGSHGDVSRDGNDITYKPPKQQRRQVPKLSLAEFAGQTSLHGVHYMFRSDSGLLRRLFWCLCILVCIGLCLTNIIDLTLDYLEFKTNIESQLIYSEDLPFPAVTICNQNTFRTTVAHDAGLYATIADIFHTHGDSDDLRSRVQDVDTEIFMARAAHQREDLIRKAFLGDRELDLSEFKPVTTKFGRCYTFNGDPSEAHSVNGNGIQHGLRITANIERYEHMSGLYFDEGIQVLLHNQSEFPQMSSLGFAVAPGFHARVGVSRIETTEMKSPHGNCMPAYSQACLRELEREAEMLKCGCQSIVHKNQTNGPKCDLVQELRCARTVTYDASSCGHPCEYTNFPYSLSYTRLSEFNIQTRMLEHQEPHVSKNKTQREPLGQENEITEEPGVQADEEPLIAQKRALRDRVSKALNARYHHNNLIMKTSMDYLSSVSETFSNMYLDILKSKTFNYVKAMVLKENDLVLIMRNVEAFEEHQLIDPLTFNQTTNGILFTYIDAEHINHMEIIDLTQLEMDCPQPGVPCSNNSIEVRKLSNISDHVSEYFSRYFDLYQGGTRINYCKDNVYQLQELIASSEQDGMGRDQIWEAIDKLKFCSNVVPKLISKIKTKIRDLEQTSKELNKTLGKIAQDIHKKAKKTEGDFLLPIRENEKSYRAGDITFAMLCGNIKTLESSFSDWERMANILRNELQTAEDDSNNWMEQMIDLFCKLLDLPTVAGISPEDVNHYMIDLMTGSEYEELTTIYTEYKHQVNTSADNLWEATKAMGKAWEELYSTKHPHQLLEVANKYSLHVNMVPLMWSHLRKFTENVLDSSMIDDKFVQSNFLEVDIYYKLPNYQRIIHQPSFNKLNLVSQVGGLLGLLIGASILTLCEFIDYFLGHITHFLGKYESTPGKKSEDEPQAASLNDEECGKDEEGNEEVNEEGNEEL